MYKPTTPEDYLSTVSGEARTTLDKLRSQIKSIVPEAEEGISYGMPAFKYKGKGLAGYSAFKDHCSYFPMSGSVVGKMEDDLKKYKTAKATIQFPIGGELPDELLKKLLKLRIEEIESKK